MMQTHRQLEEMTHIIMQMRKQMEMMREQMSNRPNPPHPIPQPPRMPNVVPPQGDDPPFNPRRGNAEPTPNPRNANPDREETPARPRVKDPAPVTSPT